MKVIEEGWLAGNEESQEYYRQNNAKINRNVSLLRDFDDLEWTEQATVKEVLHDFGMRYKADTIDDVDSYFKYLSDIGQDRIFFEAGM